MAEQKETHKGKAQYQPGNGSGQIQGDQSFLITL